MGVVCRITVCTGWITGDSRDTDPICAPLSRRAVDPNLIRRPIGIACPLPRPGASIARVGVGIAITELVDTDDLPCCVDIIRRVGIDTEGICWSWIKKGAGPVEAGVSLDAIDQVDGCLAVYPADDVSNRIIILAEADVSGAGVVAVTCPGWEVGWVRDLAEIGVRGGGRDIHSTGRTGLVTGGIVEKVPTDVRIGTDRVAEGAGAAGVTDNRGGSSNRQTPLQPSPPRRFPSSQSSPTSTTRFPQTGGSMAHSEQPSPEIEFSSSHVSAKSDVVSSIQFPQEGK